MNKTLKIGLITTFLLAGFLPLGMAEDVIPQARFDEASRLLESGDTDTSLEIYNELVRKGFSGVALYYNLGNVHYRRGERGKAILWYERAKKLAPRDSDIDFNMSLARSHVKHTKSSWVEKLIFFFTAGELALALGLMVWIFFVLVGFNILGWLKGDIWPGMALWGSGLLLLVVLVWFGFNASLGAKPWAIVNSPPGEVRNGPGRDYAVGFTVPEGSKVIILNKRPQWTEVGVPQEGLKGWLPTVELDEINTRKDTFDLG